MESEKVVYFLIGFLSVFRQNIALNQKFDEIVRKKSDVGDSRQRGREQNFDVLFRLLMHEKVAKK